MLVVKKPRNCSIYDLLLLPMPPGCLGPASSPGATTAGPSETALRHSAVESPEEFNQSLHLLLIQKQRGLIF